MHEKVDIGHNVDHSKVRKLFDISNHNARTEKKLHIGEEIFISFLKDPLPETNTPQLTHKLTPEELSIWQSLPAVVRQTEPVSVVRKLVRNIDIRY